MSYPPVSIATEYKDAYTLLDCFFGNTFGVFASRQVITNSPVDWWPVPLIVHGVQHLLWTLLTRDVRSSLYRGMRPEV